MGKVNDPEYATNQEIIQKITHFFSDYTECELILNRSEAYLISCIVALKFLEDEKPQYNEKGDKDAKTDKSTDISLDFITEVLLQEFPKALWNGITLIISNLTERRKIKNSEKDIDNSEEAEFEIPTKDENQRFHNNIEFEEETEVEIFNSLVGIPLNHLEKASLFLDCLFKFFLILFDNFVTISEITSKTQVADEAFNALQYYMKIILQAMFDYDETMEALSDAQINRSLINQLKKQKDVNAKDRQLKGPGEGGIAGNIAKRYTFVFGSEEENKEFMKQPIREQFDFYQNIIKEISNQFIKPNIMFVGFFGWKCNEYLQKLSDKAKKLLNPDSSTNQFALSNRHFIQSSLDLLSKRLYSKIELLTQSYISMDFKISTSLQKFQRTKEPENPVFSKGIKLESNKDIGSRSTECLNSSIFAYIDTLINYIDFLGSPVQSVNDYTTNLFHTLCDSIKCFNESLISFYNTLVQNTHYQKFFQDDFYVQEKNGTEFNNTVDKVLSATFNALQMDDSHFEEAKLPQRDESLKFSESDKGVVKINSDYDLLQNQIIESIGEFADPDHLPDFIYHPKLSIEDSFLKSDITKLTLFGQLSVNLADMIRSLKKFLKVYEGKIEKTKSEFAGYVNVSELHPLIKTITDVYHNSNVFIKCETICRVFLSLRDMTYADLEK